jgi:hypothetical protein
VASLTEELRTQKQQLPKTTAELQAKNDESQVLRSELARLEEEQANATRDESARAERQRELVDAVSSLHKQLEDQERELRNELAGRDDLIAQMRAEMAADRSELGLQQASLEAGESALRAEFSALESKYHVHRSSASRAEAELDVARRETGRLERDCASLHEQVQALHRVEAELDVVRGEAARFERDCLALRKEVEQFKEGDLGRKALDLALEKELDRLRDVEKEQHTVLREAQAAQQAHEQYVQKLGEELDECQVELDETREECQSLRGKQEVMAKQAGVLASEKKDAEELAAQRMEGLEKAQAMALRLNQEKEAILKQGAAQQQEQGKEVEHAADEVGRLTAALSAAEAALALARDESLAHAKAAAESHANADALVAEAAMDISERVESAVKAARSEMAAEHAKLTEAQTAQAVAEMQQMQLAMGEAHRLTDAAEEKLRSCEKQQDALRKKISGSAIEVEQTTQLHLRLLSALGINNHGSEAKQLELRLQEQRDEEQKKKEERARKSEEMRRPGNLQKELKKYHSDKISDADFQKYSERIDKYLQAGCDGKQDTGHKDDYLAAYIYTTEHIHRIFNEAMRQVTVADEPPEEFKSMYYHLKNAVTHLAGHDGEATLYRGDDMQSHAADLGISDSDPRQFREEPFEWHDFKSTSTDRSVSVDPQFCKGLLFEITGIPANLGVSFDKVSKPGLSLSEFPKENEILLPPGVTFQITSHRKEADVHVVKLQYQGVYAAHSMQNFMQLQELRTASARSRVHSSMALQATTQDKQAMQQTQDTTELLQAVDELKNGRDSLAQELDRLRSASTSTEQTMAQLNVELAQSRDECTRLRAEHTGASEELSRLKSNVADAGDAVEILEQRLQDGERQRESLRQDAASKAAEVARLTETQIHELAKLDSELAASREALAASRDECVRLRSDVEEMADEQIEAAREFTQEEEAVRVAEAEKREDLVRAAEQAAEIQAREMAAMAVHTEMLQREMHAEQVAHVAGERAWLAERQQLQMQSSAALQTAYSISRTGSGASSYSAASSRGSAPATIHMPARLQHTQQQPPQQQQQQQQQLPPQQQLQEQVLLPAAAAHSSDLAKFKDENDRLRSELAERLERLSAKTDEVERARYHSVTHQQGRQFADAGAPMQHRQWHPSQLQPEPYAQPPHLQPQPQHPVHYEYTHNPEQQQQQQLLPLSSKEQAKQELLDRKHELLRIKAQQGAFSHRDLGAAAAPATAAVHSNLGTGADQVRPLGSPEQHWARSVCFVCVLCWCSILTRCVLCAVFVQIQQSGPPSLGAPPNGRSPLPRGRFAGREGGWSSGDTGSAGGGRDNGDQASV